MPATIIAIIGLALVASFLTGIHDSSNIATLISSRALSARLALLITSIAEFVGPLIFGVGVAKTIGINVVSPEAINLQVLLAALISAVFWILLTWWVRIPSSYTHALVGGFVGAVLVEAGVQALQVQGIVSILAGLFVAPLFGFGFSWILLIVVLLLSWNATPRINTFFKRSQVVTSIALALGQGTNDSAKSMGIITLALIIAGYIPAFYVPPWVLLLCSGSLALGTGLGGMRLIRTVGGKIYKVQPVDAFASQLTSALVIISASLAGAPVSTTQVVSSSVIGVGAAERVNKVRWTMGRDIAISWVLTIPSSALISAGLYWLFSRIVA
jgi:PiT family inorganic phosphate transporter